MSGDMGRASWVLVGQAGSMERTFGTTCHGAGRTMSRGEAVRRARGRNVFQEMADRGVEVQTKAKKTLAEEMPEAYKDVREVVDIVHRFGISTKVVRLRPVGVVKG